MNDDLKRRTFLAGVVGILVGAPLAARFLLTGSSDEAHQFSGNLEKYRDQLAIPIKKIDIAGPVTLTPTPPATGKWSYVFYNPSYFPAELSRATAGEPDSFHVREGRLFIGKTPGGKNLIGGGDLISQVCSPVGKAECTLLTSALLCENGNIRLARPKGKTTSPLADITMRQLLTLNIPKSKELSPGVSWRDDSGRIKPFGGYSTEYKVAGFAEIAGRKTVEIEFSGTMKRSAELPDKNTSGKDPVVTNTHRGHAWFDIENGFLVRQESELECAMSGIAGYKAKDGSDRIAVKLESTLQIFQV